MFSFDLFVKEKEEIITVKDWLKYKSSCLPCVCLGILYFVWSVS